MSVGNARPDWPLSILMTNICLTRRSGTEIATRDLAIALRRLGHRVAIYSPTLGPFALDVMARGIPVTDRIDDLAVIAFSAAGLGQMMLGKGWKRDAEPRSRCAVAAIGRVGR